LATNEKTYWPQRSLEETGCARRGKKRGQKVTEGGKGGCVYWQKKMTRWVCVLSGVIPRATRKQSEQGQKEGAVREDAPTGAKKKGGGGE